MNVAEREVATGLDEVAAAARATGVPLVSASWVFAETGHPAWPEAVVVEHEGSGETVRIGVVGVAAGGREAAPADASGAVLDGRVLRAREPRQALAAGLDHLSSVGGVDRVVLLASLPEDELRELVAVEPRVDLAVSARHRASPFEEVGGALVAFPHSRGQSVSEVALGEGPGAAAARRFHLLDARFPADPTFLEREREVAARLVEIRAEEVARLAGSASAESEGDERGADAVVGPRACRACHVEAWMAWRSGPHAGRAGRDGADCGACHGPARRHVTSAGREPPGRGDPESTCSGCHADGWGEGGLEAAWRRLAHPSSPPMSGR